MQIDLENKGLTPKEKQELTLLLDSVNPRITDDLEQIWYLIDKAWNDMGCDNKELDWEKIGLFYAHPVWLLNGLFIEQHALSMHIRDSIAHYIATHIVGDRKLRICDYGGGFGTLSREIARLCPQAHIDIYEPFPSQYGKACIAAFSNITFVDKLQNETYDCLVCTDVLEHVDDVIGCFKGMLDSVKVGSSVLIGNCFYPVIACHLPKHFHFRYTFKLIAKTMGLKFEGVVSGASYVEIYTKVKPTRVSFITKLTGGGEQVFICPHLHCETYCKAHFEAA
ncbi:class I SAM-dependent methyltransferase [Helicobacter jaachi]|uniref:class I SAM-dependent methyltransferase n=1 Tax=Helicobacter jaachi TaxID=1677920 RepID=UPI000A8AEBA5|nr:methyltransferase domain-containing protein [Helicobacter jaachi]